MPASTALTPWLARLSMALIVKPLRIRASIEVAGEHASSCITAASSPDQLLSLPITHPSPRRPLIGPSIGEPREPAPVPGDSRPRGTVRTLLYLEQICFMEDLPPAGTTVFLRA